MDIPACEQIVDGFIENARDHLSDAHERNADDHGNENSPIDRLCLHAKVLAFIHPVTEKTVRFESPVPKEFNRVIV